MSKLPDSGKSAEESRAEWLAAKPEFLSKLPVEFTNGDVEAIAWMLAGQSVPDDVRSSLGQGAGRLVDKYNSLLSGSTVIDEGSLRTLVNCVEIMTAAHRFPQDGSRNALMEGGFNVESAAQVLGLAAYFRCNEITLGIDG